MDPDWAYAGLLLAVFVTIVATTMVVVVRVLHWLGLTRALPRDR